MVAALFVALLALGCTSSASSPSDGEVLQIPAHVASDNVVVPSEVLAYFNDLKANPAGYEDWGPAVYGAWPLGKRRANVYLNYEGLDPGWGDPGSIELWTYASDEGHYDAIAQEVARRTGFTTGTGYWWSFFRDDMHNTTLYAFHSKRTLSVGETAWVADWIISTYPDVFWDASPSTYAFDAGAQR